MEEPRAVDVVFVVPLLLLVVGLASCADLIFAANGPGRGSGKKQRALGRYLVLRSKVTQKDLRVCCACPPGELSSCAR